MRGLCRVTALKSITKSTFWLQQHIALECANFSESVFYTKKNIALSFIFLSVRGFMIWFCPERLRDFFFSWEAVWFFLVPWGCMNFFGSERLCDFHCTERLQVPMLPSSKVPKFPSSQVPKFPGSQVPKFLSSQVTKFLCCLFVPLSLNESQV